MESNITDQQYFGGDLQLTEPHFDEEATLLSARRVVPLGEVRKPRSGRRLAFGMAMVVAVMFGAFGATLIYKHGQRQAPAIVETNTPPSEPAESDGQLLSGAGGTISQSSGSSAAEHVDDFTKREALKDGATTETRKSTPLSATMTGRPKETLKNGTSYQADEREMGRAERREARRLRRNAEREAKKEARGRKSQSSNDLLRIREIFEGSPRP